MKNTVAHFLLKNLLALHAGKTIFLKISGAAKISLAISLPVWMVEMWTHWTVTNREYIIGVMACIAIDHAIGSIYHAFKLRDFTLKKNAIGLLCKIGLCAAAAGMFEVIGNTVKDANFVYEYLKMTTRLIVILYPAGSAFMNMSALTNGVFPPMGWINKMSAFNKTSNLETFKQNDNGQDNAAAN